MQTMVVCKHETSTKTDAGIQYNPSTDTLSVTNITATIDGVSAQINVADESSDTTCFPVFVTSASGNSAKSGTNLTFNSATGALTATSFVDGTGSALTTAHFSQMNNRIRYRIGLVYYK